MTDHHIIFLELNEANEKFLKKYVEEGLLPNFRRIIGDGKLSSTHIPYCDENEPRFRYHYRPFTGHATAPVSEQPKREGFRGPLHNYTHAQDSRW